MFYDAWASESLLPFGAWTAPETSKDTHAQTDLFLLRRRARFQPGYIPRLCRDRRYRRLDRHATTARRWRSLRSDLHLQAEWFDLDRHRYRRTGRAADNQQRQNRGRQNLLQPGFQRRHNYG